MAPNKSLDASGGSVAAKSKGLRAKGMKSRRRVNSAVKRRAAAAAKGQPPRIKLNL